MADFNPNEHLLQLKSKAGSQDYLPVQWRLVWFRSECPNGTIETEEVAVDLDRSMEAEAFVWNAEKRRSEKVVKQAKGYARFRAVVTDGKGGRATATGSEAAVDFTDYIEKAETKAIGRALAMLGYGTQFAPEFAENHRIVDAPIDSPDTDKQPEGNPSPEPAQTNKQHAQIPPAAQKQQAPAKSPEPAEEPAPQKTEPKTPGQMRKVLQAEELMCVANGEERMIDWEMLVRITIADLKRKTGKKYSADKIITAPDDAIPPDICQHIDNKLAELVAAKKAHDGTPQAA